MRSPAEPPEDAEAASWHVSDERFITAYTNKIIQYLERAVDPDWLIEDWLNAHAVPARFTEGDTQSYLITVVGGALYAALGHALEGDDAKAHQGLWSLAWLAGAKAAYRSLREVGAVTQKPAMKGDQDECEPFKCEAGHTHDTTGAAGFLIRSRNEDGKRVYFLHKKPDTDREGPGVWSTPGGSLHEGESPWDGANREVQEEIGDLPDNLRRRHTVVEDHGGWKYTVFVFDSPEPFTPAMNGATPEEVDGYGWFRKKEARELTLTHGLDDAWKKLRKSKEDTYLDMRGKKGWAAPARSRPAPLPPDPWQKERNAMARAGIPPSLAGALASAYFTWIAGPAATSLDGMVRTLTNAIGNVLEQVRQGKITAQRAANWIREILGSRGRASRIAITESMQAQGEAARLVYLSQNAEWVMWITRHDSKVCASCAANEAAGPRPVREVFPSGDIAPPAHPFCRCILVPVKAQEMAEGVGGFGIMKDDGGKVSKESVNYRAASDWTKRCGNCSMIRHTPQGDQCTHVEGPIDVRDVCDDWEPGMPAEGGMQNGERQVWRRRARDSNVNRDSKPPRQPPNPWMEQMPEYYKV